ncbi:hypothetical protein Tco_0229067, partial [Tanacetum coccineum]
LRFPFAPTNSPTATSQVSEPVSFPQTEPSIINNHMQNYDLSLLLANDCDTSTVTPSPATSLPAQGSSSLPSFPPDQQPMTDIPAPTSQVQPIPSSLLAAPSVLSSSPLDSELSSP